MVYAMTAADRLERILPHDSETPKFHRRWYCLRHPHCSVSRSPTTIRVRRVFGLCIYQVHRSRPAISEQATAAVHRTILAKAASGVAFLRQHIPPTFNDLMGAPRPSAAIQRQRPRLFVRMSEDWVAELKTVF